MKRKILIVYQKENSLRELEPYLIPLGHAVISSSKAAEILKLVFRDTPDLIIIEIASSGSAEASLSLIKEIKKHPRSRSVAILALCHPDTTALQLLALEAGVDDFLMMPVTITELIPRINCQLKLKFYDDHIFNDQTADISDPVNSNNAVSQRQPQLNDTSMETIFRLVRAAEFKDIETAAHIQRMSHYSATIASNLDMRRTEVDGILFAATMHDVGKIGIPDKILLKPGALDEGEWKIMKQHPLIGARILQDSRQPYIQQAEIIAKNHHERWDGSGYPDGLKGDQIPIEGRITALADTFDTLTSKRPYKKAFSTEHSISIIKNLRGKHFDPVIVDVFLDNISDFLLTKETFKDSNPSEFFKISRQSS